MGDVFQVGSRHWKDRLQGRLVGSGTRRLQPAKPVDKPFQPDLAGPAARIDGAVGMTKRGSQRRQDHEAAARQVLLRHHALPKRNAKPIAREIEGECRRSNNKALGTPGT